MSVMRLLKTRSYFGSVIYPPGGTLLGRRQTHFQMVAVHSGELNLIRDGRPQLIPDGHVLLLLPGRAYDFYFSKRGPTRHTWIDYISGVSIPSDKWMETNWFLPLTRIGEKQIETLSTFSRNQMQGRDTLFENLCASFLDWFLERATHSPEEKQNPSTSLTPQIREWLEANLSNHLTLADFADEAGMSREHFSRQFRKETGLTPMTYLWKLRVEKSQELLTHTGLSLEAIATQTGFSNVYHFSRRVRAESGYPPKIYRERMRRLNFQKKVSVFG